jgi:hypothetical protein
MTPLIDTSKFQLGVAPDEDDDIEAPALAAMAQDARAYMASLQWAPPVAELLLAYGIGGLMAVFLVRYAHPVAAGQSKGDREAWVVVGDMPSMCFETETATTPILALRLYAAIAQDWADNVLKGADLSQSYPVRTEPTREHAKMLKTRIQFIRKKIIPAAERQLGMRPSLSQRLLGH